MGEVYHFQVNLGGMLDILSNHLYKTAEVFLRELMQNGVDAITLRRKKEPDWNYGKLFIQLVPGHELVFTDNGAGLTEEEIHHFLAVIGQSSKHDLAGGKIPEDFIGRFGIGLLSCFMVSDSIVVRTRSADSDKAYEWKGFPDGTYTLEEQTDNTKEEIPVGTSVFLTAKKGCEVYFQRETIMRLVRYYGLMLPVPIYLNDEPEPLNYVPSDFRKLGRGSLLAFGEWLFDEEFLDAIPIHTKHLSGVAYVLSYKTDATVKEGHRIYLKNMLLTDQGVPLLPDWAFFLRCFINTYALRPTASRESFYENDELEAARTEFAEAVKQHFAELVEDFPNVLQQVVAVHYDALKSMAVWDNEMFRLFIDYLSFETSEGEMTGSALKHTGAALYINNVSRFKQLKPIFMAQGKLLICTGYMYDEQLILKMADMFGLNITPLHEEDMGAVLKEIPNIAQQRALALIGLFNKSLQEFDCQADIRRFYPIDLPVIYYISDDVQFLRQMQDAKENSRGIFSEALASLLSNTVDHTLAMLYLNYDNPLIQRLLYLVENQELLQCIAKILYIQALAAGGHSLHQGELKALNQELIYLVDSHTL